MPEQKQAIIVQTSVAAIKPYEKNAKKHPEKQLKQIAASIKEFGFNQPIVADKAGVIIVGHGRYAAATEILQMDTVPVITLDLTEEQARAYRLADNKLNESPWDMELVVSELKELSTPMLDLTGFSRDLVLDGEAGEGAGSGPGNCQRCEDLKDGVTGHENRSGHNVFAGSAEQADDQS